MAAWWQSLTPLEHILLYLAVPATLILIIQTVLLFVGGMILFMLGLIGEYIGRIYISLNNSPQFVVRETWNVEEERKEELKL